MGSAFVVQVMHEEDVTSLAEQEKKVQHLADGDVLEFTYRLRRKSREWRWFVRRDSVFRQDKQAVW
jgi:hypothetical protein